MLEVHALSRRYGGYLAVKPLSFVVRPGEIIGLLGHNGAGKTTLMKMLSGYLEPHSGSVRLDDIDLATHPKLLQRQLGYLPESLPVYPELLVADYLDYAATLKQLSGDDKANEIRRVMQATQISDKALQPISTLSRGYKQRVGVAQALLGKPRLLILDEPTNGLDPAQTLQMRALIKEIARDATVILSTHIMQEVTALCDRVLLLRQGELVLDAALADLQGQQVSLHTSASPAALAAVLATLPALALASTPADGEYLLQLKDAATARDSCAALTTALVQAGHRVSQLCLQGRDLESLFYAGNQPTPQQQEVSHAA